MARDLLTQLRNISCEFDDASETNKELFEALSPILQAAELKRQRENNLPLLPPMKKKSTLGVKYKPLSLNKKKNSNKRVGEIADQQKKAKIIKIEEVKREKKTQIVEEEEVPMENVVVDGKGERFETKEIIFVESDEELDADIDKNLRKRR